jgi:DNA-binding MarR family transcriptional regulator
MEVLHRVKYSRYRTPQVKGSVATRLNSATVHIGRALRKDLGPSPLAAEHRSALGVVFFAGPIRMGALASAERVGAPAMTKTVAILEHRGLVRRERDPNDERAVLIRATRKGASAVRSGRDDRVRRIEQGLRQLRPDARHRVAAAVGDLEDLIDALERENRAQSGATLPSIA